MTLRKVREIDILKIQNNSINNHLKRISIQYDK